MTKLFEMMDRSSFGQYYRIAPLQDHVDILAPTI